MARNHDEIRGEMQKRREQLLSAFSVNSCVGVALGRKC